MACIKCKTQSLKSWSRKSRRFFQYKLSGNLKLLEKSIFKIALPDIKFQGLSINLFTINSTTYFLPNSLSFILWYLPVSYGRYCRRNFHVRTHVEATYERPLVNIKVERDGVGS